MVETGTVVFYDERHNYGFIEPDIGSGDLTFRLAPGEGAVQVGDNVTFERLPTPIVTPIGPTAWRVRLAGFLQPDPRPAEALA